MPTYSIRHETDNWTYVVESWQPGVPDYCEQALSLDRVTCRAPAACTLTRISKLTGNSYTGAACRRCRDKALTA